MALVSTVSVTTVLWSDRFQAEDISVPHTCTVCLARRKLCWANKARVRTRGEWTICMEKRAYQGNIKYCYVLSCNEKWRQALCDRIMKWHPVLLMRARGSTEDSKPEKQERLTSHDLSPVYAYWLSKYLVGDSFAQISGNGTCWIRLNGQRKERSSLRGNVNSVNIPSSSPYIAITTSPEREILPQIRQNPTYQQLYALRNPDRVKTSHSRR